MQVSMTFNQDPSTQHTISVQKILGQGKFQVYHAKVSSLSDLDLALKVFPKTASASLHFAREKQFLSKVSHPNIISYIPILQHNLPHYILATEYTPNGDFFDFVTEHQATVNNEKLMRTYFRQLIEGLEYLHGQGIAHLDLKLENILLDKDYNLKILDFDQGQFVHDTELRSGGTEGYRAPEMILRKFKSLKALDIYAAGILLYAFFTGQMPFVEAKVGKVCRSATYAMFRDENEKFWREKAKIIRKEFSEELREMLNGMWDVNPEKRMRTEDVKRSKWYNGEVYTKEELKREVKNIFEKNQA